MLAMSVILAALAAGFYHQSGPNGQIDSQMGKAIAAILALFAIFALALS